MKARPSIFRRLLRDQRGAIAVTFVLSFTAVMLGGTLFSIDMVRYNTTQSRLQNALDAAVISSGRKLAVYTPTEGSADEDPWKEDAYQYFRSNMPENFFGSDVPLDRIDIQYLEETTQDGKFRTAQRIRMVASGELPLLSTGYLPETTMKLYASNWAVRRVRSDLELVLALDNTGSMKESSGVKGKDRMDILKEAATGLIATVMAAAAAGDQSNGTSGAYIGLVPFTDSVNMKDIPSAKEWLSYRPAQESYIQNNWLGCIIEPASGTGKWTTAQPLPAQALVPTGFQPMLSTYSLAYMPKKLTNDNYFYLVQHPDHMNQGQAGYQLTDHTNRMIQSRPDKGKKALDWYVNRNEVKDVNQEPLVNLPRHLWVNFAQESEYCTQSKALFLSQDKKVLDSAVNAMKSYGGTNVPTGLLWAWRMLHPEWRGTSGWGNENLPRDAGSKLKKVIVLLSDGDNAPVVKRGSMSVTSTNLFNLSYAYRECVKTSGSNNNRKCTQWGEVKKISSEVLKDSLPKFDQCPIDGLNTVDPTEINPNNYNQSCQADNTRIGYPSGNNNAGDQLTATALNNYMNLLCSNIKTDGNNILVYTLTLGKDVGTSAKSVMRNCATSTDAYYDVSNAEDLPDVFAEIAGALTELRLTPPPETGI